MGPATVGMDEWIDGGMDGWNGGVWSLAPKFVGIDLCLKDAN